jgi:hypothetical protein
LQERRTAVPTVYFLSLEYLQKITVALRIARRQNAERPRAIARSGIATRGGTFMTDAAALIRALEARIRPDATLEEAEGWWSLALTIGSALDPDDAPAALETAATRRLAWAVSAAVRALKRSEPPDCRDIRAALAGLERSVGRRVPAAPGERPAAALASP